MFRSVNTSLQFISRILICLCFSVYQAEYQVRLFVSIITVEKYCFVYKKSVNERHGTTHIRVRNDPPIPPEALGKLNLSPGRRSKNTLCL